MFEEVRIPAFDAILAAEGRAPARESAHEESPWRATRTPGVSWILISPDAETLRARPRPGEGEVIALIRMEPGCGYPPHRHLGAEEVLVLRGGYRDEEGEHRAGSWARYPAGSIHAPVALGEAGTPPGPGNEVCILFAVARGGTEAL